MSSRLFMAVLLSCRCVCRSDVDAGWTLQVAGVNVDAPFQRLSYADAIAKYASGKALFSITGAVVRPGFCAAFCAALCLLFHISYLPSLAACLAASSGFLRQA
jgi:hypothetical protein